MSNDEIEVIAQEPEVIEIVITATEDEITQAGAYLMMREMNMSMQAIAEKFGLETRKGMYDRVNKWSRNGALQKAREQFIVPKYEDIRQAYGNVVKEWPQVILKVLNIALHGRSDRVALEAAAWLNENVVKPELEDRTEEGSAEKAYAQRAIDTAPTTITLPAFIKKP